MPFPTHHMTIRWGNRQCCSRPRSCLTNINFKIDGGQTRLITVDVIRTGTETAGRFASNNRSEIYINSIFYLLIQINSHDSVQQILAAWFICLWLARLAWQLNKQRERTPVISLHTRCKHFVLQTVQLSVSPRSRFITNNGSNTLLTNKLT